MATAKRLTLSPFRTPRTPDTARPLSLTAGRYWKKFKFPVYDKKDDPITSVHFNPSSPHDFAITTGLRVHVYDAKRSKIRKTITRFKSTAYSARFRSDGRLLVAGSGDGLVQVFEMSGREILRSLSGHTGAVRYCDWSATKKDIFTCSDDKTAGFWDLASGSRVRALKGHTDYVRCGQPNPSSVDVSCEALGWGLWWWWWWWLRGVTGCRSLSCCCCSSL